MNLKKSPHGFTLYLRPYADTYVSILLPDSYIKKYIFLSKNANSIQHRINSAGTGLVQPPDKIVVPLRSTRSILVRQEELIRLRNKWLGIQVASTNDTGDKIVLSDEEQDWISKHPTIRVSNETDWPPFDFAIGNQPQGYSVDIVKLLAGRIGTQVEFVNGYTWNQLIKMFKNRKLDLVHSLFITPDRKTYGIFTESYYKYRNHYIVKKESQDINTIEQLYGKIVAVIKGFSIEEYLVDNHPEIQLLSVPSLSSGLKAVSEGKADAFIEAEAIANYNMQKEFIHNLKVSGWCKEFDNNQYKSLHMMVQKDTPELKTMLDKAIASLTPGDLEKLEAKWLGTKNEPAAKNVPKITFTDEEQEYLKQKGVIKMCVDPDWMPYERINEQGKHEGFAADLINSISERSGIDFELIKTKNWSESIEAGKSGQCDILTFLNQTPERDEWLLFAEPLYNESRVFITHESHPFIFDPKKIKGESIALSQGYSAVELVRQRFPNLSIVLVETESEAIQAVSLKKADMTLSYLTSAVYNKKKGGLFNLKIAGQAADLSTQFTIGVVKTEPMLIQILNKVIRTITPEQKDTMLNKYISVNVTKSVDYTLIWKILGVVTLVLCAGLFWIRRMAVMNRRIRIAQQQTEAAKNSAEALVEKRTKELRIAKEAAETANKAKSDLLMNMGHELRTPLNAVLASVAMITGNEPEEVVTGIRATIESSSYGLLETIEQIINYTRSKDGKLELESSPFALDTVLNNLKTRFVHKGSKLDLLLEIKTEGEAIPNKMIGDAKKLLLIINPLLENAAKFCRNKPKAILSIKLIEATPQQVCIQFSLKDNGIGIPKEFQEKIFEPFSQADTTSTREFDGTGMGLSLCKQLVELMGGKIWMESEQDEGSTFYFTTKFGCQDSDECFELSLITPATKTSTDDSTHSLETIELDISVVEPNLIKLNQALLESDPKNIRNYLTELQKYQIPKLSELTDAIDDYEFEDAVSTLNEIASEIGVQIE